MFLLLQNRPEQTSKDVANKQDSDVALQMEQIQVFMSVKSRRSQTTKSGWEQASVLNSGSDLQDLDWTHVGAPFGLSSQERWLFLNQLDLQLFICKVLESEVLQPLDFASQESEEFYLHRHLFWEGFPSLHQIPGTLLWEVRWLQSSEGGRRALLGAGCF